MHFSRIVLNELIDALDRGLTVESIVARNAHFDVGAAYELSAQVLGLRRARGESPVGRKIGFTNRNIWAEYGANAPIWAHVFDRTVIHAEDGIASVSLAGSVRPRIEPEIAFRLREPIPAGTKDPVAILRAIEWYAPSFEIVDCHFADWRFEPADAVADFSLHWRLVVGTPCAVAGERVSDLTAQLRDCTVTLARNGQTMDRGTGANALDHPLLALAFLADLLRTQPLFAPLAPGEVITTGTLTAALPITHGETWTSHFEGLAGVTGLTLRLLR